MSVPKINRYARIQGKTTSLATAKLAIFGTDILWKSCFKLNLEQLFHTMSIVNITILAVARKNMSIATNYKKSFFTRNNINLCKHNQNSLDIPKSPPGDPIFTGLEGNPCNVQKDYNKRGKRLVWVKINFWVILIQ